MTAMATFHATLPAGEEIIVRGVSIEDAAQHAIERVNHSRRARAVRVTGSAGLSGIWQGYRYLQAAGASTSVGPAVHLA